MNLPIVKSCSEIGCGLFKAGLYNGDYRSKLVPFEAQKNIFYIKKALA